MSVDADRDDRNLEAELTSAEAGQVGVPVDAVCVGCGRTCVKRTRLEAKTDHLLMTTLRDMGETARDVSETVATDGGATVGDLADQLGNHPATIYRAISDLGEILELDQGDVSFRAWKCREELRSLVESAEYAIESYADRMQHIMGLADHVAESSPFQEWPATNGADLEFNENGDPRRMRIDTLAAEGRQLRERRDDRQ